MLTHVAATSNFIGPAAPASPRCDVVMQGPRIDDGRRSVSPGIQRNFYDMPTSDFKRPFDRGGPIDDDFGPDDPGPDFGPPRRRRGGPGFDRYDRRPQFGPSGRGGNFLNFLGGRGGGGGPLGPYDDRPFDDRPYDDDFYVDEPYFDGPNAFAEARDSLAFSLRVTPEWLDTAFGCIIFALLGAVFKELSFQGFPKAANIAAGQALTLVVFAAIQQAAFLPTRAWLRFDAPPFSRTINGISYAFAFAIPFAFLYNMGVAWLPKPTPFPAADGVLLQCFVTPLLEESFFRAWLLTAFTAAGGSEAAALIFSTVLFVLYHVPMNAILGPNGGSLILTYQALGVYLCFLYQRSGGSLPLVLLTDATLRLIELGGGRVLP